MNTNIDRYKPVKYLVFTTNALRNNEGDGTLNYYDRYITSYPIKNNSPFNKDHPQFCYYGETTVRFDCTQKETINRAKSKVLESILNKEHKNYFNQEDVLLLLSCNSEGRLKLDIAYYDSTKNQWSMEPFDDLAYDSNLSDRQTDHIMKRLTDFYEALQNNPNARITDLQERYLSWY